MFNKLFNKELEKRVAKIEKELFVKNYFYGCPCCEGGETIPRHEAVVFPKLSWGLIFCETQKHYTTKEGAKAHKAKLDEFAKEIKDYEKKNARKSK